ncbi:spermatogenesis associated 2-like isoform X2 [Scyliorhinus canicula]|uniref:spermatogenesis associated 2-like isoform X2 n=1 Tax=Scyliorhinus canicula TaxID=7830 RepID=UPI0018F643FB|nr:spermatogenesis associated 2-like isoform X2 [Scyliorhinus canicula]
MTAVLVEQIIKQKLRRLRMSTGFRLIFEHYKTFCEDGYPGNDGICHDKELKGLVRLQLIKGAADVAVFLRDELVEIICKALYNSVNYTSTLKLLIGAFELLELAAVNLFQYPWRNEFKTIKTFSGAFVHYLKPAICNEDLVSIFKKMGYKLKDDLQLEMEYPTLSLELIRLAFEFFVTRIECEILLEIVGKLEHYKILVDELLRERKLMESIDMCVNKLRKCLPAADRSQRERQFRKTASIGESFDMDVKMVSGERNEAGSPFHGEYDGNSIHSPPRRLMKSAPVHQPQDDARSKYITGMPGMNCVQSLTHQDNKFDFQGQAKDRCEFSSDISPSHTDGNTKMGSPKEAAAESYKLHGCLANGESAHVCCETCCTMHTIMCKDMNQCYGHSRRIFGPESLTCLQNAEASKSDLKQLSYADMVKTNPNCRLCRNFTISFRCKCGTTLCSHCAYKDVLLCKMCGGNLLKI